MVMAGRAVAGESAERRTPGLARWLALKGRGGGGTGWTSAASEAVARDMAMNTTPAHFSSLGPIVAP